MIDSITKFLPTENDVETVVLLTQRKKMSSQGYGMLMTSTQVDEDAQHFYRKLGYKDCGGFVVDAPGYEQPMEMIMIKAV